jgi:glycosyltransferase involved in cell wall biosynthesis
VRFLQQHPAAAERARLVMIGDGPLKPEVERILDEAAIRHLAWLPGARGDIADVLRLLDCFVLPSEAEGTSCTLQEAMACGLPAIATAVGGTPQLVEEGATGLLVAPNADDELAAALWRYFSEPNLAHAHGSAARQKALDRFALAGMIERYDQLFSGPGR